MTKGKAFDLYVIHEIKRLRAEGRSYSEIQKSLRRRGMKVARSTVVLHAKDVKPVKKSNRSIHSKNRLNQVILNPTVVELYDYLVKTDKIDPSISLSDFVNSLLTHIACVLRKELEESDEVMDLLKCVAKDYIVRALKPIIQGIIYELTCPYVKKSG
jgi:hypothetical protein